MSRPDLLCTREQKQHVIGMAGVLDSARFRTFIAMELNVSVEKSRYYPGLILKARSRRLRILRLVSPS
jgi:hypothetical protein